MQSHEGLGRQNGRSMTAAMAKRKRAMTSVCGALLMGLVVFAVPAGAQPLQTAAPVAYLVDVNAGKVLFSRNADRRIAPASMTKMMTAFVVFDLVSTGRLTRPIHGGGVLASV